MVGVLVHAEVGDEHHLVADLGPQVLEGELDDPLGIPGPRPFGVLGGGHAEEDHAGHAEGDELADLLAEGLAGVLHDPRQAGDRLRFGDALAHEQRGDEVIDGEPGLGNQAPGAGCVRRRRRSRRWGKATADNLPRGRGDQ